MIHKSNKLEKGLFQKNMGSKFKMICNVAFSV